MVTQRYVRAGIFPNDFHAEAGTQAHLPAPRRVGCLLKIYKLNLWFVDKHEQLTGRDYLL